MKVLLALIVALGILPAPVSFERADGTSTVKDVEIVEGKRAFAKWSAFLPEFARKEAYRLTITPKRVRIEANTPEGTFRAQTPLAPLELTEEAVAKGYALPSQRQHFLPGLRRDAAQFLKNSHLHPPYIRQCAQRTQSATFRHSGSPPRP